jgi:hypothetical protein
MICCVLWVQQFLKGCISHCQLYIFVFVDVNRVESPKYPASRDSHRSPLSPVDYPQFRAASADNQAMLSPSAAGSQMLGKCANSVQVEIAPCSYFIRYL